MRKIIKNKSLKSEHFFQIYTFINYINIELYLEKFETELLNQYMCTYYDSTLYCLIINLRENHTHTSGNIYKMLA